jgi:tetratricopeptide (TPR) repeat protein
MNLLKYIQFTCLKMSDFTLEKLKELGDTFYNEDNDDEAKLFYELYLDENPTDQEVLYNLGELYFFIGEWDLSLKVLGMLVTLDKNNSWGWNYIGLISLFSKHFKEAEEALRKAVENDPGVSVFWVNLSKVFNTRKVYDLAEWAARKALVLDPNLISAWVNLRKAACKQRKHNLIKTTDLNLKELINE